jgi:8-oxo-dGTP diphosphatase
MNSGHFPGGKQRRFEKAKECLMRELMEELPKVRLQRIRRWKKFQRSTSKGKRRQVVYRARYLGGTLEVGDKSELMRAEWRYLNRSRLAPAAEMVTRKLFEHIDDRSPRWLGEVQGSNGRSGSRAATRRGDEFCAAARGMRGS